MFCIQADSEAGTWSPWSACSAYGVQQRRQPCTSCEAGFRLQERFCDPQQTRMTTCLLRRYFTRGFLFDTQIE